MESAVPRSIRLIVDSVERVALLLRQSSERDLRRMVIVDSPIDALRLKRAGVQFDHLNLGNIGTDKVRTYLSR
jgi:mannose/fructose/N-acetylgalactosamine-specific phosphotransferase system component IIB